MSDLNMIMGSNQRRSQISRDNEAIKENNMYKNINYINEVKSKTSKIPKTKSNKLSDIADEALASQKVVAPVAKGVYKAVKMGKIAKDVSQIGASDVIKTSRDARRAALTGEGADIVTVATQGASNGLKDDDTLASIAEKGAKFGKILGGGTALLGAGEDVQSLISGKGLIAGNNLSEKVANITGTIGGALTFVPGGELVGGALDLVSLGASLLGESQEKKNRPNKVNQAIKSVARRNLQSKEMAPSWSSLGILSNHATAVNSMIHQSGNF